MDVCAKVASLLDKSDHWEASVGGRARRVKRDLAVYGKLSPRRVPVSAQIKIRIRFTILLSPEILPCLWSEKDSDSSMISRPLLHRPFVFKPELPHTLAVSLFENRKSYRERGFGSPDRGVPSTHPRSRIYIQLDVRAAVI